MRERIILAPGSNATELQRSFARFGINNLGLHILSAAELASRALLCAGQTITQRFLPRNEEAAVIASFLQKVEYFHVASYTDAANVADALFSARCLITEQDEVAVLADALSAGEFPEKNRALLAVFHRYQAVIREKGCIDSIGLLRLALSQALPMDADFSFLPEFPLSPLEMELLTRLSKGSFREISLPELFDRKPASLAVGSYTEAYGASNEVQHIIGEIYRKGLPLDQCVVAVTNPAEYAQLFYEFSLRYDIPLTLGCGVPILNANPARLLKALDDWDSTGYHGTDALKRVILSDAFDRKKLLEKLHLENRRSLEKILEVAGSLRLSYDGAENSGRLNAYAQTLSENGKDPIPALELLSAELAKGCVYLVSTYAFIRTGFAGRIDRSAANVITNALKAYTDFSDGSVAEVVTQLLGKAVCSENSREGCLHVTGIGGVLSAVRENLFIAGLSATNFPGTPRENYLMLDCDYSRLPNQTLAPISTDKLARKKKQLSQLLDLAAALEIKPRLSYSGFSLSELKTQNPSSMLFEIYKKEHGEDAAIDALETAVQHTGFFAEQLGQNAALGRAILEGKQITVQPPAVLDTEQPLLPQRAFSPTDIEKFFECPMKFYLSVVLRIKPPETDNPFTVIAPRDTGTLAHSLMERLANRQMNKSEFLAEVEQSFTAFLQSRPPLHSQAAERERERFCHMMEKAYDMTPARQVLFAEEQLAVEHPSGITLRGIPDRVESTENGCIVVDFKTGKRITHKENDVDSCLQTLLYAYMLEQSGVPTVGTEYRYLHEGKTVCCRYDEEMKAQLNEKLTALKTALDSAEFSYAKKCDYCDFKSVCDNNEAKEVSEDA